MYPAKPTGRAFGKADMIMRDCRPRYNLSVFGLLLLVTG
jgi:hypothetical protein